MQYTEQASLCLGLQEPGGCTYSGADEMRVYINIYIDTAYRHTGGIGVNWSWATYMDISEAHRKLTSSKRRVLFQTKRNTFSLNRNNTFFYTSCYNETLKPLG